MMKSMLIALSSVAVSASVYASDIPVSLGASEIPVNLGIDQQVLGSPLSMPMLALIGAVGLIAGIKYLRNKRS
jgi:hypothetical protein